MGRKKTTSSKQKNSVGGVLKAMGIGVGAGSGGGDAGPGSGKGRWAQVSGQKAPWVFCPHEESVPFEPGSPNSHSGQEGLGLANWAELHVG